MRGSPSQQDFVDELGARVQALQQQNFSLLAQMASAAKMLNAAIVENQILKDELQALGMTMSGPQDNGRR
ncbi:hypothetical protein FOA52_008508 [Chlamydomonas sp. UWO 241]|nr:hypothetical protein FOA52_008508 [Chlamydomonas sp. UWO 241]